MAPHINKQLTDEIIPRTTRGRVRAVVVGAVLCALLFNFAAVWYLAEYSPNIGYLLIAAKWHLLRSLPEPVEVLILGDSGGNQGVDPSVIWEKLRHSSINLCTIGDAMVLNDAWMLEDYLKRYGTPKAVLIVHGYDIWSREINISVLSKIPGRWWQNEPSVNPGLKDQIRIYLNRYVPIYAETRSMAQVLQNPWQSFHSDLKLEPNGFMVEPEPKPQTVIEDGKVHLDFVRRPHAVLSDPNRKALEYIRKLADVHQFEVFIVNGPLYDELYADSAFQVYYEKVRETITQIASGSERMHFILDPPMTFSKDKMQSADHVTAAAARDFTARIAEEIMQIHALPGASK